MISGIVLVPLYLKHIPQDIYGAWLATGNILAWLTIVDPGLSGVLRQRVAAAYGRGDHQAIGEIISAGLFINVGVIALIVGGGLLVGATIPSILGHPPGLDTDLVIKAFSVTILGTGGIVFYYSLDAICKGFQRTLAIGLIQVAVRLTYMVVLVFLLLGGFGLMALAYGQLFNGLALSVVAAIYLSRCLYRENIRVRFSMQRVRELASLLSFTFFARGLSVLGANMDLVFTARLLGPVQTPVLALTRRVPESVRPLIDRPAYSFLPAISLMYGNNEIPQAKAVLIRLSRTILWALGLFAVGFILLNGDFVRLWIGSKFYAGRTINALICLGIVLGTVESSLNGLCFAMGDIKGTSVNGAVRGTLSVALMLFMGTHWGMTGLVTAPIIAILATSGWYLPRTFNRQLDFDSSQHRALATEALCVLTAGGITGGIFAWFDAVTWSQFALLFVALIIVYACALAFLSVVFRAEVAGIVSKFASHLHARVL